MIRRIARLAAPAALCLLVGCPEYDFSSEEEQWTFEDPAIVTDVLNGFQNDNALMAGTALCPAVTYQGEAPAGFEPGDVLDECVEHLVEGPGALDGQCLMLQEAGEVTWYLDPTDCPLQEAGLDLIADRVVFEVADPVGLDAEIQQWVEEYAVEALEPVPAFPSDWTNPPGEPFRVIAGHPVSFFARLRDPSSEQTVAWRSTEGALRASAVAGSYQPTEEIGDPGWIGLSLDEGATVDLTLTVGDHEWTAGRLEAVGEDQVASMEIVAGYLLLEDDEKVPYGARAVLRDADGNLLYGAPVQWQVVDGDLAVYAGTLEDESPVLPGLDYAALADECVAPSEREGTRTVSLQASYGGLTDRIELTWNATSDEDDESWEPSEMCQHGGCSCSTDGGRGSSVVGLALVAIAFLRFRRRH